MEIGWSVFVLAILIIAVWVVVEIKRLRHKIFAILLIILILFTYFSFSLALKDKDVDLTTISGMVTAGDLYFSWLGYMFNNMKSVSTYAFKKDWKAGNQSLEGT